MSGGSGISPSSTTRPKLDEVLQGPSIGLQAGTSRMMHIDEFTSSRLAGVSYADYLDVASK